PAPEPADKILKMPVLILWGRKDAALSAEMAKESLGMCSQAELIFIDHATHWVQHDASDEVNDYLCKFLQI
ncbi:MAG: alpha/beta hydrolase, partial [Chloroflexota bacterium]